MYKAVAFILILLFYNQLFSATINLEKNQILILDSQEFPDKQSNYDILPYSSWFIDSSGLKNIDDIIKIPSPQWDTSILEESDLYFNNQDYWIKLSVINKTYQKDWFIGIESPQVYLYSFIDGKLHQQIAFGNHVQTKNPAPYPTVHKLHLPKNQTTTIYIKRTRKLVTSIGQGNIKRFSNRIFNANYVNQVEIHTLKQTLPLFGIMLTIFIYHLILFIYNKEINYLLLSLMALSTIISLMANQGYFIEVSNELFYPGFYLDYIMPLCYIGLGVVFPFTYYYLDFDKNNSTINYILFLQAAIWFLTFLLMIFMRSFYYTSFLELQSFFYKQYFFATLTTNPVMLGIGIWAYIKNRTNALFYLLGIGVWFLGSFIAMLSILD